MYISHIRIMGMLQNQLQESLPYTNNSQLYILDLGL